MVTLFRLKNGLMLEITSGDLTDLYTDAIVLPNNTLLNWESELVARFAKKAGASVLAAARAKSPIPLGEAIVTPGGGLLSAFVVHVALFSAHSLPEDETRREILQAAIANCFLRCEELGLQTLGMPNVGEYVGLSAPESAHLMYSALEAQPASILREIHLVLREDAELAAFKQLAHRFSA